MAGLDTPYWIAAQFIRREGWDEAIYPFNLPVVRSLHSLKFHPRVTFLVGENGSGKSTLIEALAVAWGFNAEGGSKDHQFATHANHSVLHQLVQLGEERQLALWRQRRLRFVHDVEAIAHQPVLEQREEGLAMRLLVQGPLAGSLAAGLFEVGGDVEEALGPQEEAVVGVGLAVPDGADELVQDRMVGVGGELVVL